MNNNRTYNGKRHTRKRHMETYTERRGQRKETHSEIDREKQTDRRRHLTHLKRAKRQRHA